jgi:non-ribosomal peptide synthetase component E (peptide arylation enzyme)
MAIDNLPLTSPDEAAKYRAMGLWHDKTFCDFFLPWTKRHPDKIAIIEKSRRWTYAQLRDMVDNVAGNLLDLGLKSGDIVAIQTKNSVEQPLVHLACNRIGLLCMPLHDSWRDVEVRHLLQKSHARVVITPVEYRGFDHAAMIAQLKGELPDLIGFYTIGGTGSGSRDFAELLKPTRHSAAELESRRPDPDLPAACMLSGGTTSLSKISRFTCNDLMVMIERLTKAISVTEDDIVAGLAPAGTGATGYIYPILLPLLFGATSVILERWGDPEEAIDLIIDNKCTFAVGIPTQLTLLVPGLEKRKPEDFPDFRCFYNAGSALPYDTALKVHTLMNCYICSMYGTTDGGVPVVTTDKDSLEKQLSTVGKVVYGCECELWDENGKPVPKGESGEVVWRSPDKSYGYLGDDEQTAKAFTADRFYKSGDLGQFDAEGYLKIVGRVKDMILRGGRNISPLTIEEQLIKHPSVVDVSVVAMPDPILGERACACVILRSGATLEFQQAVDFLKEQKLAVFQLPERLEIVDDFPRGPGGKILKSALTKMVVEKLKAEGKIPT